nr:reverse transcriptase domain-containing protein [Tanacetum cinerariifolium]
MSSRLTSDTRIYADKARDLNRQLHHDQDPEYSGQDPAISGQDPARTGYSGQDPVRPGDQGPRTRYSGQDPARTGYSGQDPAIPAKTRVDPAKPGYSSQDPVRPDQDLDKSCYSGQDPVRPDQDPAITTRSGVSYDGPQIPPPVVENKPEATKDTVNPTNNENTKDVQPQTVQSKSSVSTEPEITLVSASKPNPKASIPYPTRRNDERNPLIGNKEKLSEMARTPLNEHYSAVLLKKLPEKLGDPVKFLIPCDFPDEDPGYSGQDPAIPVKTQPYPAKTRLESDIPGKVRLDLAKNRIFGPKPGYSG